MTEPTSVEAAPESPAGTAPPADTRETGHRDGPGTSISTDDVHAGSGLRRRVRRSGLINIWATASASVVAVLALVLSLITTVQVNSLPDVSMTLPNLIRMEKIHSDIAGKYEDLLIIQPTLTVDRTSNRTAIVSDYNLEITPPPTYHGPPMTATILWFDENYVNEDTGFQELAYKSDPIPLAVTQDTPQAPLLAFSLRDGVLAPGRSTITLTLVQSSGRTIPMTACVDLSPLLVREYTAANENTVYRLFNKFTAELNSSDIRSLDPMCYRG